EPTAVRPPDVPARRDRVARSHAGLRVAPPQLQCRLDRDRPPARDAADLFHFLRRCPLQPAQAAEPTQQFLTDRQRRPPANAATDQHREQFAFVELTLLSVADLLMRTRQSPL